MLSRPESESDLFVSIGFTMLQTGKPTVQDISPPRGSKRGGDNSPV